MGLIYRNSDSLWVDVGKFDMVKYESERAVRLQNADIKCLHSLGIPCTNPKKHIKVFKLSAKQKSKQTMPSIAWKFAYSPLENELNKMAKLDEDYHYKDAEIKSVESAIGYYKKTDKKRAKKLQKNLEQLLPERDALKLAWESLHNKHWGNCVRRHFIWFDNYLSCNTRRWLEFMKANGQLYKYYKNYEQKTERMKSLRAEINKELSSLENSINNIIDERVRDRKKNPNTQYKKITIGESFLRKLKGDWTKIENTILNLSEENERLRYYLNDTPNKTEIKKIVGKG